MFSSSEKRGFLTLDRIEVNVTFVITYAWERKKRMQDMR